MRKTFSVTLLLLVLLTPHAPVLAWGDIGHMVVAQIAFTRLNDKARRRITELFEPNDQMPARRRGLVYFCEQTYTPVSIANWMDDMRDDSMHDDLKDWHHMNRSPLVIDGLDIAPEPSRNDVLNRIEFAIAEIRDKQAAADDGRYDLKDKQLAELLGYLYHMVGDVHQPLHTTTRYSNLNPAGDLGGNRFFVSVPDNPNIKNLHSFWDAAGGLFGSKFVKRPLEADGKQAIGDFASNITTQFKHDDPQQADWKKLDPTVWVRESNDLAKSFAFARIVEAPKNKPPVVPGGEYTKEAQKIAARRIAFAGYRLGETLNNLLGQP